MKIFTTGFLTLVVAAAGLFTAGCPERTSIGDIETNPGRYQDKEVAIAGVVKDSYGLSIPGTGLGGGAYKIDDGTGAIWVVVADGSVPQKGAQVGVKVVLGTGVSWKGRNYGLGLYEKDRRYQSDRSSLVRRGEEGISTP